MLQVYTSNYSKYHGHNGVQISNGIPRGYPPCKKLKKLFPDWDMVNRWNKLKNLPKEDPEREYFWTEEFVPAYWNKLESLGIVVVKGMLEDGDVLLCYCSGVECHRHILANWLRLYGVWVEELR